MAEPSIEELRMLLAVQKHGSLTAAAEALNVTQQAVSQRMRALERRLGLALFVRQARGTTLTTHGRLVADWALAVVDQLDALTAGAASLRDDRAAHLRISASLTIAEHLVPSWLVAAHAHQPHVRVELTAVNSATVVERVRAGTDDVGFIESPSLPARLRHKRVGTDEVILVVAPRHPWATRRTVSLATVARTPLVMREPGSGTRVTVERALEREGHSLARPAAELSTTSAMRAMVLAGGEAAAMSAVAVADDLAMGRLVQVPVNTEPWTRPFTAVWDGTRNLPASARDFLDQISRPHTSVH
ncbi:LysR family transcriptional regulator [Demequina sp. B12]|uniref:LysR family transcriptional regulator n=1 Tax=Demequina sp. B12 TaxID=2992757 RepID=UPI00237AF7F3|nr:LysR family transcriptional regulator [Demequina sp. B12]MDE0572946.1 LysR family transcriptional regulator [Demequina sp. B12]